MTAVPFDHAIDKTGTTRAVVTGLVRRPVLAFALGFPVAFYLFLLGVLVVEYGHLPNYVTPYDWIGNVAHIVHGTPSVADMLPIILNEWLLEIGYMDFDYGHGVAEWSLSIIPHKLAIMSLAGALIGLNIVLLFERHAPRTSTQQCVVVACRSGFLASLGALCAGLTSTTIFSVACCAAPSWAAGLTVLGVQTSLAFALEPFGPIGSLLGILALTVSALWIASDGRPAPQGAR
jgi:hypothetical protein